MKKIFVLILILYFVIDYSTFAHAGAVAARRQQGQAQSQQRAKREQQATMQRSIVDEYQRLLGENQEDPAVQQQLMYYQQLLSVAYRMSQSSSNQIVQMSQVWTELQITTEIWPFIIDPSVKAYIIGKYVEWYGQIGIVISKQAGHYVNLLDSMAFGNPGLLKMPFDRVLQIIAIMEYDFNNGQDPDELALQVFGPAFYEQNRTRLGLGPTP